MASMTARPPTSGATAINTVLMLRWLMVAALIVPTVLFGLAAWNDRAATLAKAEDDGTKIIALFYEQAQNLFSGHDIILDIIINRTRDQDWDTIQREHHVLLEELETIDRRLDEASEILLVDAQGKTRATTLHLDPNDPLPAGDRDCFQALRRSALANCISAPHRDPVSGQTLFSLSRRLENGGLFNGIAQVAISADYIVTLWAASTPSQSDAITMFRTDGAILARSGPQSSAQAASQLLLNAAATGANWHRAGSTGALLTVLDPGRITMQKNVSGYPISIRLDLDKAAILATWRETIVVYGLFAAFAVVGMVLALGLAAQRARKERQAVGLWETEVRQRETAQEQLIQSQKMESLGGLTGGIAHDFNNILGVIMGNLDLALLRIEPGSEAIRHVDRAIWGIESAAALIRQLLAFARKQPLTTMPVAIGPMLLNMEKLLRRTLGEDIEIRVSSADDLWLAMADVTQVENALLNLALNARDAMPDGGVLRISASNATHRAEDAPRAGIEPGQYVVLTVADTGCGMPPEVLARVFEPFFTTKDLGKGTGLGLAMVYGFVRQSGGHVEIVSEPGSGTVISLYLPRASEPVRQALPPVTPPRAPVQGSVTVLVVEDDPAVRDVAVSMLRDLGYQVLEAADGAEAIRLFGDDPGRIDLLLADVLLPGGMKGDEVGRRLADVRPGLPVLFMSGYSGSAVLQRGGLRERTHYIDKPFRKEQLAQKLAEALGG